MAQKLRSSGGGQTVLRSLGASETDFGPSVALRETRPHRAALKTVVCQNALNFISLRDSLNIAGATFTFDPRQLLRRSISQTNVRRAATSICLTAAMGRIVQAVPNACVQIIPVTVPTDVVSAVRTLGTKPREQSGEVLHIGGIFPYKDLETLVDAVGLSKKKSLTLLGSGSSKYANHLVRRGTENGIDVRLGNWDRETLLSQLATRPTVVSTSRIESLGFPAAEAAVFGCPVYATELESHREIQARIPGSNFVLFPVGNAEALAALLSETADFSFRPTTEMLDGWDSEWTKLRTRLEHPAHES